MFLDISLKKNWMKDFCPMLDDPHILRKKGTGSIIDADLEMHPSSAGADAHTLHRGSTFLKNCTNCNFFSVNCQPVTITTTLGL